MKANQAIIYTLGTSARSWGEFATLLRNQGVMAVVDVRRFPTSRFEHFKKEIMAKLLAEMGIAYLWFGETLGGYRRGGYQTFVSSQEFAQGIKQLEKVAREKKVVVLCAEIFPWRCHRRFISQELERRGWLIRHIIDEKRYWVKKGHFP